MQNKNAADGNNKNNNNKNNNTTTNNITNNNNNIPYDKGASTCAVHMEEFCRRGDRKKYQSCGMPHFSVAEKQNQHKTLNFLAWVKAIQFTVKFYKHIHIMYLFLYSI